MSRWIIPLARIFTVELVSVLGSQFGLLKAEAFVGSWPKAVSHRAGAEDAGEICDLELGPGATWLLVDVE
jgi:hypothetical protein